jgi:hypothetical protein
MTKFERLVLQLDRAKRRYQKIEGRECDDAEFNPVADAQFDAEDALLDFPTESRRHLDVKIKILKRRAAGGISVTSDVMKL